jgi:NADPH2:quinone reductase
MHAIEVRETGGPEVLRNVEKPAPSPGPGEVLIKAEAISVNFVDTYFRSGSYPHELPFVLGAEVGGTVEALGDGVTALRVGERVATADAVGAYAEYCVAPANVVASVPAGVSSDVAAAATLKGMTAHLLIKSVFPIHEGDTVLVHAGAGGVGLILTQWATSLGARVFSTASSPQKVELSRKAGAVDVLSYPGDAGEFGAKIRALTDGKGVAAVYDGSAGRHSTPASPAWRSEAPWHCSVLPVDQSQPSIPNDSIAPVRSISPGLLVRMSCVRAVSSPGVQTNYSS